MRGGSPSATCFGLSCCVFLHEMASAGAVAGKRQVFYEVECQIEDFDCDTGYKPRSHREDLEDSGALGNEDPRQEDFDSSEEWEPKLKRSSSLAPRRRGRPPKLSSGTVETLLPKAAPERGSITGKPEPEYKPRRGRRRKPKPDVALVSSPAVFTTIISRPLNIGIPTSVEELRVSADAAHTVFPGARFGSVSFAAPISAQPVFTVTSDLALVTTPTHTAPPTGTRGDEHQTEAARVERPEQERVSAEKKILEARESSARLSSSAPAPSPVRLLPLVLIPDLAPPDPSVPSPTTMDDQLSSIFFSEAMNGSSEDECGSGDEEELRVDS